MLDLRYKFVDFGAKKGANQLMGRDWRGDFGAKSLRIAAVELLEAFLFALERAPAPVSALKLTDLYRTPSMSTYE
jgi:hypothetical protein